jgi:hypothetical protein
MITTNGTKYVFVCDPDECDTLIEVTCVSGFDFPNGVIKHTCPCGREMSYISATILTSQTTTKEEKMEDTPYGATATPAVPESYNSNLLVTYKVIKGYSEAEYATDKVTSIEWELHNGRDRVKQLNSIHSKIDAVKEIICEAYADSGDQDTLREIAEALGIELIKEVQFTASIEVSGTYSYDILSDYSEYELESVITDSIYAESNDGNVQIDDTEVCNVREA